MPRGERELDGEDTALVQFALDLRRLRDKVGSPSYRELARRAHYSSTTLSDAAGGRQLPTLAVVLAYVRACEGDAVEWEQRWRDLVAERSAAAGSNDAAVPPYLGLAALQPEDADRLHGRTALLNDLVERLARNRFLAVVGASGVGKSSLLRAGLIPRVRAEGTSATLLTPGPQPLAELEARGADDPDLLVIDQFEEVFTLCHSPSERARFIAAVLDSRARVVIGLRADFVAHCADHPKLLSAMSDAQVLVGAMTTEELRQMVVAPASQMGYSVDGALVAAIVADADGRAAALPLVSHALLETWRRRHGNALTLDGYRSAGGIRGALAQTAEARYTALSPRRQLLARELFLRLTAFGEGTEDTRRRISRDELDVADPDTAAVLDALTGDRLITLDESTVELTHEALITAWPRLHQWLVADRDGLRTHRRLTEAAHTWTALDRDPGVLYRGAQLTIAREWSDRDGHHLELNSSERMFLDASIELEARERKSKTRRDRLLRYLTIGLVALLLIAVGTTFVAVEQRRQAVDARQIAISRQLATQAQTLVHSQPDTAMLLSVQAYRTAPTAEARSALLGMSIRAAYQTEFPAHAAAVSELAFTPDGRSVVTASADHTMAIWDARGRNRVATLTEHDTWLRALAISPDGATLASGGDGRDVVLWHLPNGVRTATLTGQSGTIKEVAFSSDGRLLATGGADDLVVLWDVARRTPIATLTGHGGMVNSLAFSPDGRILAAAGEGRTVVLWDVLTHKPVRMLTGHTGVVHKVVFDRGGRYLASASRDSTVRLWQVADGAPVASLTGHEGSVIALAFSPDGGTLASAGNDATIRLWDTEHRIPRARLAGHTTSVYALAFSPDGSRLASAGESGSVILWDTARSSLTGHPEKGVNDLAFSPDGRTLAVAAGNQTSLWDTEERTRRAILTAESGVNAVAFGPASTVATANDDGTVTLWPPGGGTPMALLAGHSAPVLDLVFAPNGRTLVTGGVDRTVIVWDVATRSRLTTLTSQIGEINGVAFSPDGGTLATTSHDHTVVLWDTSGWSPRARLSGHTGWVRSASFSPDGRTLATASNDSTVVLWDVATGTRQTTLTGHVDAVFNGVAFAPDGRTLTFTGDDHTIMLWDVRQSGQVARLAGHTKPVRALAFSPNGRTLASAGGDDAVQLWDTDANRSADHICDQIGRDLTPDEWRQLVPDLPHQSTCRH